MIDNSQVLKLAPKVAVQQLGDGEGAVLLELDTGQLHTCNHTSAAMLSLLGETRSFGSIVDELWDVYEIDREELRADLSDLAGQLLSKGLLLSDSRP